MVAGTCKGGWDGGWGGGLIVDLVAGPSFREF